MVLEGGVGNNGGLLAVRARHQTYLPCGMKILLTGYSGFTGQHFLRLAPCAPLATSEGEPIDLLDRAQLAKRVEELQPEAVVHLAAQTFVPDSFADPHATFEVNVTGTLNLLSALAASGFKGRLLYVSSAEVYGLVPPEDLPLREAHALRPRNPYAASKVAAEALVFQHSQTSTFETVIARPFNQLGSGQRDSFAIPNFAKQIIQIKRGGRPPKIEVGDIDVTRDFSDIRDTVRAYALLLERGENGQVYNICSGKEQSVRSMLERLLATAGIEAEVAQDPSRIRPSEQKRVVGSHEKLRAVSGWQPEISTGQTISEVLAYWEEQVT